MKRAQPPGKRALGESVTRTGFAPRITPSRASASFPPRNVSTRESSRSAAHASAPTQTRALARRRHSSTLRARETRHANWARFRVFSPRARDGTEGPRRSPCPRTSTSSSSRNGASRAKETAARRHATASRTYPQRARARVPLASISAPTRRRAFRRRETSEKSFFLVNDVARFFLATRVARRPRSPD